MDTDPEPQKWCGSGPGSATLPLSARCVGLLRKSWPPSMTMWVCAVNGMPSTPSSTMLQTSFRLELSPSRWSCFQTRPTSFFPFSVAFRHFLPWTRWTQAQGQTLYTRPILFVFYTYSAGFWYLHWPCTWWFLDLNIFDHVPTVYKRIFNNSMFILLCSLLCVVPN